MTPRRWAFFVAWGVALSAAGPLGAQERNPRIGCIFPAGGRQGTEVDVTVAGQYLDGVNGVRVSGTGVRAYVVDYFKPLSQGQLALLRARQRELLQRKMEAAKAAGSRATTRAAWTAADERMLAEIARQLAAAQQRRPTVPALSEQVTVHLVIARNAEPGLRELRLITPSGMTNTLWLAIGQLPEVIEPPDRQSGQQPVIPIPATVNGQILPGEVDRYRFKALKGQRLVVAVSARALVPYIADAVPGWFQATVALYDAAGRELSYADDFLFHPDPVLYYRIPADGEYVLEVRDALYRGRDDFVYRISIGEVPFITSIFPLGCRVGTQTTVELRGWNFPRASIIPDAETPGVKMLSVRNEDVVSNRVPFRVDTLPECMEQEPDNQPGRGQPVQVPITVNGRINYPGDVDVYRFEGRAGQRIIAEVVARRLNSPLDSLLRITDASGRQLGVNDDFEDKAAGLVTHHADSLVDVTLPADGTYLVHLADAQRKGGPEYAYRLRIAPPQPDFELRVVPASINVRAGSLAVVNVFALRRDGFAGDIALNLANAPEGFALSGAWVPAGQDQVRLTLLAPPSPQKEPISLCFEGRAKIDGREVVRRAVPADDMMQAFAYHHLVPVSDLKVAVLGRGSSRAVAKVLSDTPLRIPAGGTGTVKLAINVSPSDRIVCQLSDPPEGISVEGAAAVSGGVEITIRSDAAKAKPGLKGNLIVGSLTAETPPPPTTNPAAAQQQPRRTPLSAVPAIPFEVVAP